MFCKRLTIGGNKEESPSKRQKSKKKFDSLLTFWGGSWGGVVHEGIKQLQDIHTQKNTTQQTRHGGKGPNTIILDYPIMNSALTEESETIEDRNIRWGGGTGP